MAPRAKPELPLLYLEWRCQACGWVWCWTQGRGMLHLGDPPPHKGCYVGSVESAHPFCVVCGKRAVEVIDKLCDHVCVCLGMPVASPDAAELALAEVWLAQLNTANAQVARLLDEGRWPASYVHGFVERARQAIDEDRRP